MTVRALIVEDEPLAQHYLTELLLATGAIDVVATVSKVQDATLALDQQLGIDVAFVDVRLIDRPGDASGLAWARAVAQRPGGPMLVLATAMADHAVAAFDAGAVDYLLKPFTRQRVAVCVERLLARAASRPETKLPSRLLARTANSLVFLPIDGVLAFEAAERLTYVHHIQGRHLVDLSLSAIEPQFAERILRSHRNWLVALDHVRELGRLDGELSLQVGENLVVPVSRDRASLVREALLSRTIGIRR